AESKRDFIHKIQVVLKELRESLVNLKISDKAKLFKNKEKIESAKKECNELISIFVKSSQTAKKNI
ncbi:MAG: four helix bundle protein, partial [Melioribacteraceae bacterium]|nr:four helix bundle protein [Melioribacteraceae bacterium]